MFATFQNSASVLSIGVFFTVLTLGIASALPNHLYAGLMANGLESSVARSASNVPPIGSLFSAFLGINPVQQLVHPAVFHSLNLRGGRYVKRRRRRVNQGLVAVAAEVTEDAGRAIELGKRGRA